MTSCAVCQREIPDAPPPELPDNPEAWRYFVFVDGREFSIHRRCYEANGSLGVRMFIRASLAQEAA